MNKTKFCLCILMFHCEFKLVTLLNTSRLQAARQLQQRIKLQFPRLRKSLWEHVVRHGEGVPVMRCGSICSISVRCKNESIYFHIQMAQCAH